MFDTATYVRIFDPNPSDDLVTKRDEAIESLAKKFTENNNLDALLDIGNALAVGVGSGVMPQPISVVVEAVIKESSPSFIYEGNELQALVCALLAVGRAIDRSDAGASWFTIRDGFKMAPWGC